MTRPDYTRIAQLERELGLVEPEPPRPRRAIRELHTVCLTKHCEGDTEYVENWGSSTPLLSIHTCLPPTT